MTDQIADDRQDTGATTGATSGASLLGGSALAEAVAADEAGEPTTRRVREAVPPDRHGWWWGTGRRKSAVARVRMKPAAEDGKGDVQIQCTRKKLKAVSEYFTEDRDRADVFSPLEVTGTKGRFDILVRCNGGGYMGQAQAVRLGIARALRDYDPSLEDALRDAGFLSRDARKVERKKPGQPGARRRFQFSKR
ncbi:MAG: 30S ribosomal protein S9 [Phycisphaerales bacterium]